MKTKKYQGKTCAYCGAPDSSTVREHVIARKFFFVKDRGEPKLVPACDKCNGRKSELERYALAVLPIGSRLEERERYFTELTEPRLLKDLRLMRELAAGTRTIHQPNAAGLHVPGEVIPIRFGEIAELISMIVRGLYLTDFGFMLPQGWIVDVATLQAGMEEAAIAARCLDFGKTAKTSGNLGNGTFVYEAIRSIGQRYPSVWKISAFDIRMGAQNGRQDGNWLMAVVRRRDGQDTASQGINDTLSPTIVN